LNQHHLLSILLDRRKYGRTIPFRNLFFLRELPPIPVTGPTLVYKRTKAGSAGFFCFRCGLDFSTTDPLEAFHGFSHHQHQCTRQPKRHRKVRAAKLAASAV
jgi:hypothetical protein